MVWSGPPPALTQQSNALTMLAPTSEEGLLEGCPQKGRLEKLQAELGQLHGLLHGFCCAGGGQDTRRALRKPRYLLERYGGSKAPWTLFR